MHVYSCHTLTGLPVGTHGWAVTPGVPRSNAFNDCETGPRGALYINAAAGLQSDHVSWWFSAAPDTSIVGFATAACFRTGTSNTDGPIGLAGMAWPNTRPVRQPPDAPRALTAPAGCEGGAPYWADARNHFQRALPAVPRVHFTALCFLMCTLSMQASVEIASFRADIRDDSAPTVSAVVERVTNTSHSGVRTIHIDATDTGSGVFRMGAEMDLLGRGTWTEVASSIVGSALTTCTPLHETAYLYEFDHPQPCPLSAFDARLSVDNAQLPVGEHRLRVFVEDASGNRTTIIPPRTHVVPPPEGTARPALSAPAPALVAASLAARPTLLRIADAARRSLPASEPFRVRGTLTEAGGRPVAGVPLTVRTRPFLPKPAVSAGDWTDVGQVVTGPDGSFDARVPAGSSRTVQVTRDAADGLAAAAAQIDVVVPAQVQARARSTKIRNGRSTVISGRVAGPIPAGGVLVALEVREPGRWIPVATTRRWVRTTPSGRFRLSYRFLRTFQPSTYRFRVAAAEDSAFAYTRGVSRTIAVRVRP